MSVASGTASVALTVEAAPTEVHPGNVVTYTIALSNAGQVRAEHLIISDTLPTGLVYVPDSAGDGQYDPPSRQLTWSLEGLDSGAEATFGFQARVRGDVLDDLVVNHVEVTGPDLDGASQAQATVAVIRQAVIPPEGGVLETPSGRLRVTFPPGAVAGPVTARFVPRTVRRLAARQAGLAFTFDVGAIDPAGQRVTRFARPLTITLQLDELVNWASRPNFLRPWVAYQDETTGRWVSITPTRVDEPAGTVTFTTDHFSLFGAGTTGVEDSGWVLNFNDTRVNRFAGALTWTHDFNLPVGPGGTGPSLPLTYNSRRLDGVLTWAQSDGMGFGWNLDTAEVLWRNVRRCSDGANYFLCWDDVPLLVLNGEALKLIPETAMPADVQYLGHSGTYRYRTEDDRLWRIEWKSGSENGYWEVTLRDGTRYLLGTTTRSRQTLHGNIGDVTEPVANQATVRWRLREIVYPTDVSVTYTYTEQTYEDQCALWTTDDQFPSGESCQYGSEQDSERASYLTQIDYPGTRVSLDWQPRWNGNGPNDGIAPHAYRWDFNDLNGLRAIFWQTDALQKVVLEREKPGETWSPVQEWHLTYATYIPQDESNKQLRILENLQPWSPQGNDLPAFTFGYTGYQNKDECSGTCSAWDQARFYYPRLTSLDNGYGGVITATYATLDGGAGGHTLAKNYRVTQRTVNDGQSSGHQELYAYSDSNRGRCYLETEDATQCKWPDQFDYQTTGGRFLGYREVTTTFQSLVGTSFKQTYARFALPDDRPGEPDDPWAMRGRLKVETAGEPGATPLHQITNTWAISATVGGANFVYLEQQDTTTDGRTDRTAYRYDDYGNITTVFEHGALDVSGDERSTHRGFYPNPTDRIVDRLAWEKVYEGITEDVGGSALQTQTINYYDGTTDYTTSPTDGLRTRQDRGRDGWGWVTTHYDYSDVGNLTVITDTRGFPTTYTYDPWFEVYLTEEQNAQGHITRYEYYGINESDPGTGSGLVGALKRVVDANDAATVYSYDVFSRLTKVIRPGDTITTPTTVYTYTDAAPGFTLPLRVQVDRRVDGDTVGTSHYFYDGLGRLIQTKDRLPNNQQAVQHTTYNTQGLVADEYVPYAVPASANYEPLPNPPDSKPRTRYEYDALGRQTLLTHPDDRTVQTGYTGRRTTVVDENNHQTVKEEDAFGRLAQVEEYTGTGPYTLYATTRYGYDVLDLMTVVTDTTGITTTIAYDPLGRKTAMDDPDMGQWAYEYDAAGNLTQQIDARGCITDFSYDGLKRLTGKTYGGPAVCSTPAVVYSYDAGAYGVGRRTGMSDAAGFTAWSYDARGRVVTETRRIGALGVYTTTYTYDGQDRVVTMHYPDPTPDAVETGEIVTTTYNAAGWPAMLTSSLGATYVTDASYTPEGRPDVLSLGSNLQINHDYYAWNAPDGRGRLQHLQAGPPANPTSLQNLSYTYDAVGNVQTITDNGQTTSFTYDALDRLRTATGSYSANYTYDTIGNLLTKTEDGTAYTLQYTDPLHVHAPKVVNGAPYAYDANGNPSAGSGQALITRTVGTDTYSLTYDAENRLRTVTNTAAGETVTFTYDGDGRRVLRDTDTQTTVYVGPHYELRFSKTDKLEDLDDDCRVTVADIMQVAVQWGVQGPGIPEDVNGDQVVDVGDVQQVASEWRETCHVLAGTTQYYTLGGRRIAMRKVPAEPSNPPGTLYYLFADHLRSTNVAYDTTTGQTQTIRYYPWGSFRSGDVPTDRRFTGQRWDGTIDLYDYNARWYDQTLGRFIQPDSLALTMVEANEAGISPLTVSYSKPSLLVNLNKANRLRSEAEDWTRDRVPIPLARSLNQNPAQTLAPDNPQVLNRYAYGLNNPLVYTDETGEIAWIPALIAIGAGAGGIGNTINYVLNNQENLTWRGAAEAFVEGAVAGGVGTFMGIGAAILAPELGVGVIGTAALSGAASGFFSNATSNVLSGQAATENWALATGVGAGLGPLAQSLDPQVGFRAGYSLTRGLWSPLSGYVGPNTYALYGQEFFYGASSQFFNAMTYPWRPDQQTWMWNWGWR